jgi:hypothetical protein
MNNDTLLPLLAKLKSCPAHDASVSREAFLAGWDVLRREDLTPFLKPTLPVMAALLVNDAQFKQLLNAAEQAQLLALVNLAIDRYDEKTNPPNKLGKLIAGSLKQESI